MALSSKWRVKKSNVPAIDLANSLTSLRKVIGDLSNKNETVLYGGMSYNEAQKEIVIDRQFALKNIHPIPDDNFDVLTGLAIHESIHSVVDSHSIKADKYAPDNKYISKDKFFRIAEEVYVDQYVNRKHPIHYKYLTKARAAYKKDIPVDWNNIEDGFISSAIYSNSYASADIDDILRPVYAIFTGLVEKLSTYDITTGDRQNIYRDTFHAINELLKTLELKNSLSAKNTGSDNKYEQKKKLESLGFGASAQASANDTPPNKDNEKVELQDFHGIKELEDKEKKLLQEVKVSMELDSEDITSDVLNSVELPSSVSNINSIVWEKSNKNIDTKAPSIKLLRELDWIKRMNTTFGKQIIRGQKLGKLDTRRLYRHYTDELVYKVSRKHPDKKLKLQLLLDGSKSMLKHMPIYEAAKALHKVVPEVQVLVYQQYDIDKYRSMPLRSDIFIRNITFDGKFRQINPSGYTPSALALASVALKFSSGLLIHFTDGQANEDIPIADTLTTIARNNPNLKIVNIMMNHSIDKRYLNPPATVSNIIIQNVSEFPNALRLALKPWYMVQ